MWVSRKKLIIALSKAQPSFFSNENLEPEIFDALSKSNIPSFSPISQWCFGLKENFVGSPTTLTTTLSLSLFPTGVVSSGIFGILIKKSSIWFSTLSKNFSFSCILVLNCSNSSSKALSGSFPSLFNFPTVSESVFLFNLNCSISVIMDLLVLSQSISWSKLISWFLFFNPSFTISIFSLNNLISNILSSTKK